MKKIAQLLMFVLVCLLTMAPPQCPITLPPSPPVEPPPGDTGGNQTSKLPDTGQDICYEMDPADCKGQDSAYLINPMSFRDNNETVTDLITGLAWLKESFQANWFQASGTFDLVYNPLSQNICGELGMRLPTPKELQSIMDYSISYPGPTINTDYFPDTQPYIYWTSQLLAQDNNGAWIGNFRDGRIDWYYVGYGAYVRCVSGAEFAKQELVDNKNGTVTDKSTGLTWMQKETEPLSLHDAIAYCEDSDFTGFTDWRMPNVKEIGTLIRFDIPHPAIDTWFFTNVSDRLFWTSTWSAVSPYIYLWDQYNGEITYSFGSWDYLQPVRCVRSGGGEAEVDTFKWPLSGSKEDREILSGFGDDWLEYCGGLIKKHTGIDIAADEGETAYATKSGIVKVARRDRRWGGLVTLEHNASSTSVYWHIFPSVTVGKTVAKGDPIGRITNYGGPIHLHFGVRNHAFSSDNIPNRGALPQTNCGGDPAFPEYFVDPETFSYE